MKLIIPQLSQDVEKELRNQVMQSFEFKILFEEIDRLRHEVSNLKCAIEALGMDTDNGQGL